MLEKTAVLTFLSVALLHAQSGHGVSILPAKPGAQRGSLFGRDRVRASGATLEQLLSFGFDMEPWQISGPDWIREARYDVVSAPDQTGDVRAAVLDALVQTFSITYHSESRLVPAWVVRLPMKPPGRLKEPNSDHFPGLSLSDGPTHIRVICHTCELSQALEGLERLLRADVRDETGVNGVFDFSLLWKKDDATDMVRAWRDETGLEFAQEFKPADVVVIYHIARPGLSPPERPAYACEVPPDVRATLESLPRMDDYGLPFAERLGGREELTRRHPDMIVLQLRVQDALRSLPHMTADWDRALVWYRRLAHPYLRDLLEARLILPFQKKRSEQLLMGIPEQAAEFPWARLTLAEWSTVHAPDDIARLEARVREFRSLCPQNLDVLAYTKAIRNADLRQDLRNELGGELSRRVDAEAIRAFPAYWDLLLDDEPGTTRARIQMDIQRLRVLNRIQSRDWVDTMLCGYAVLHDDAAAHVLTAARRNSAAEQVRALLERWRRSDTEADAAAADEYLDLIARHPDLDSEPLPAALKAAAIYASHARRDDQVASLVERGLLVAVQREEHRRLSDVPTQSRLAEARIAEAYEYGRKVLRRKP